MRRASTTSPRRGPCRAALAAVAAAWCAVAGVVTAQPAWSVQTVALRDFREAQNAVAELRGLGFPAFTEFTMNAGLQYVRVRVGCTSEREVADAWATLLAPTLVAQAVAVPLEADPPEGVACVLSEIGFRKPTRWSLVSGQGEVPVFEVVIADQVAYLGFDGAVWRVWQGVAPEPAPASPSRVAAGRLGGVDVVRTSAGELLCPGRLLVGVGDAAVVELGDAVVVCWPEPSTP
ncbi:MAG: SPOR domain-containing protein [Trueperaceae bacterium]|nr:SPOR domain-containing protein [Trueperaceae bacterium]